MRSCKKDSLHPAPLAGRNPSREHPCRIWPRASLAEKRVALLVSVSRFQDGDIRALTEDGEKNLDVPMMRGAKGLSRWRAA